MKGRLFPFLFIFLFFCPRAEAFLSQSDPDTFYEKAGQAQGIFIGVVQESRPADGKSSNLVHVFRVDRVLSGGLTQDKVSVFEERVFAEQTSALKPGDRALVFLASLPNYTSFQNLKNNGVLSRFLGGSQEILKLSEAQIAPIVNLIEQRLAISPDLPAAQKQSQKLNFMWSLLGSDFPSLQKEAALSLAREWPAGKNLQETQLKLIAATATQPTLSVSAKIALIQLLEKTQSKKILKNFAEGPDAKLKWPAVAALERLGEPRPIGQLAMDFSGASQNTQNQLADLIMKRRNAEARNFFFQVFRGPEPLEVKRSLLVKLSQQGDAFAEDILLREIKNPDPQVAAHAMAALGQMNSLKSIELVLPFLESQDKRLRDAAIYSLTLNKSPAAQQALEQKYQKDSHGHFAPKRHFHQVPGIEPGR